MSHFEKAIQFVRENGTFGAAEIKSACAKIDQQRRPLRLVDYSIDDEISDLMEEYGEDNGLSEGWWLEYGDTDDILRKI